MHANRICWRKRNLLREFCGDTQEKFRCKNPLADYKHGTRIEVMSWNLWSSFYFINILHRTTMDLALFLRSCDHFKTKSQCHLRYVVNGLCKRLKGTCENSMRTNQSVDSKDTNYLRIRKRGCSAILLFRKLFCCRCNILHIYFKYWESLEEKPRERNVLIIVSKLCQNSLKYWLYDLSFGNNTYCSTIFRHFNKLLFSLIRSKS